jgi:hypothetical protein
MRDDNKLTVFIYTLDAVASAMIMTTDPSQSPYFA